MNGDGGEKRAPTNSIRGKPESDFTSPTPTNLDVSTAHADHESKAHKEK